MNLSIFPIEIDRIIFATLLSLFIAGGGYLKKSLDFTGFLCAFIVGFHSTLIGTRFALTVILFFIISSILTKFKSKKKLGFAEDASSKKGRNWIQVFSNGFPGTIMLIGFSLSCIQRSGDHYLGLKLMIIFII